MKRYEVNASADGDCLILEISVDIMHNKEMSEEIKNVVTEFSGKQINENTIDELEQSAIRAIWRVIERQSDQSQVSFYNN